jgi:hypothetical protein
MDPRLENPPDFLTHDFLRHIVQDKIKGGATQQEALDYAHTVWLRQRDDRAAAWNAQQAQQQAGPPINPAAGALNKQPLPGAPPIHPPPLPAAPVVPPAPPVPAGPKIPQPLQPPAAAPAPHKTPTIAHASIVLGRMIHDFLTYRPDKKILEKLRTQQYIPLFHFLKSTHIVVFECNFSDSDEITLQLDGKTLMLTEKRMRPCKGDKLSYHNFHAAQTCLLASMASIGYPPKNVERLAHMFTKLD